MVRRPHTRIAKLTRVRSTKADGYRTLHFTTPAQRRGRCPHAFIGPEHVPEFDGEEAWFELERVPAIPWPYWRALRQVEPPPER